MLLYRKQAISVMTANGIRKIANEYWYAMRPDCGAASVRMRQVTCRIAKAAGHLSRLIGL
jgi:hypothetical protein